MPGFYQRNVQEFNREPQQLTSPFGDGNCAFYAYSCGLLEGITTDKIRLTEEVFNRFKTALIKNMPSYRIDRLDISNKNKDAVKTEVNNFIEFILTNPTFKAFKGYLGENQSVAKLMALNLAMSPALRAMACDSLRENYREQGFEQDLVEELIGDLPKPNVYALVDAIEALNKVFNLSVRILAEQRDGRVINLHDDSIEAGGSFAFTVFLSDKESTKHMQEHWHLLSPSNKTGLLGFLDGVSNHSVIHQPPKRSM